MASRLLNRLAERHEIVVLMPYKDTDENVFGLSNSIRIKNLYDFPRHDKHTLKGAASLASWKLTKKYGILDNEIGSLIMKHAMFSEDQKDGLITYINGSNFDVVIGVTDYYTLLVAQIADRINAATVGWEHNTFESYYKMKDRNSYGLLNLCKMEYKKLDMLFVLTDADRDKFEECFGVNTYTVYNPLSFDKVCLSAEQSKDLIFVGRLYEYQKGLDYLLDIMERIHEKKPMIRINIIGDGKDRQKFENKIKERGLENAINVIGMTDCVQDFYKQASIFLHTSRYEGFGLVLIEAMSFGIPVVAFHNNGPDEIVSDGESGILIKQYDTEAFANTVLELLDNQKLYNKISTKASKRAEDFSLVNISNYFEDLLAAALRKE